MYVCVCKAVTDRQIREAAQGGARTLKDLRRELGVTRDCGRCASCAHECLREAHGVTDEAEDIASSSLIENWIDETERRTWFLFEAVRPGDSSGH